MNFQGSGVALHSIALGNILAHAIGYCSGENLMLTGYRGLPIVPPKGPFMGRSGLVLFGGLPGFAVVGADFDTGDGSRSIEGNTRQEDAVFPAVFTGFGHCDAIVGVPGAIALDLTHEGVGRDFGGVGPALVFPEAFLGMVDRVEFDQPFGLFLAEVSRDQNSQWETVFFRQWCVVHLVDEKDIGLGEFGDRQCSFIPIVAFHCHFDRGGFDLCFFQEWEQSGSGPFCVAN